MLDVLAIGGLGHIGLVLAGLIADDAERFLLDVDGDPSACQPVITQDVAVLILGRDDHGADSVPVSLHVGGLEHFELIPRPPLQRLPADHIGELLEVAIELLHALHAVIALELVEEAAVGRPHLCSCAPLPHPIAGVDDHIEDLAGDGLREERAGGAGVHHHAVGPDRVGVEHVQPAVRDAADFLDLVVGLALVEVEGVLGLDLLRRPADLQVAAVVAEAEGELERSARFPLEPLVEHVLGGVVAQPDQPVDCEIVGLLEVDAAEEGLDGRVGLRVVGEAEVVGDDVAHDVGAVEVVDEELAVLRVAPALVLADGLPAALTSITLTHLTSAWPKLRSVL